MTKEEMIRRQQEILDGAKGGGRNMDVAEREEFDGLQRKIDEDGKPTGTPGGEDDARNAATLAERQRTSDITALCREADMDPAEYIKNGTTMENVRKAAVDHLLKHGRPVGNRGSGDGNEDNFRQSAVDAMLMRSGLAVAKPSKDAEKMRNHSLRDMAIECLSREGHGTQIELLRMSKDDLWNLACRQFFNTTAAFPAILDASIKKTIENSYQLADTTFQLWTSKGVLTDFKHNRDHSYTMGGAGDFLKVGPGGELKADNLETDMVPLRKLDTYGRTFSMDRQAFINDDIGFVSEMPGQYAIAAKRTINKQVYEILVNNPAIHDGVTLFNDAHGNLISSGADPSIQGIQDMMNLMLHQTAPTGEDIMVKTSHILVPAGYGFLMAQLLETSEISVDGIGEHTYNALQQYRKSLSVVEEVAINGLAGGALPWFTVGNKNHAKSIQVDYLNGIETPSVRRMEKPGQLGYTWDMYMDWAITVMDHRGIAKNVGKSTT